MRGWRTTSATSATNFGTNSLSTSPPTVTASAPPVGVDRPAHVGRLARDVLRRTRRGPLEQHVGRDLRQRHVLRPLVDDPGAHHQFDRRLGDTTVRDEGDPHPVRQLEGAARRHAEIPGRSRRRRCLTRRLRSRGGRRLCTESTDGDGQHAERTADRPERASGMAARRRSRVLIGIVSSPARWRSGRPSPPASPCTRCGSPCAGTPAPSSSVAPASPWQTPPRDG